MSSIEVVVKRCICGLRLTCYVVVELIGSPLAPWLLIGSYLVGGQGIFVCNGVRAVPDRLTVVSVAAAGTASAAPLVNVPVWDLVALSWPWVLTWGELVWFVSVSVLLGNSVLVALQLRDKVCRGKDREGH